MMMLVTSSAFAATVKIAWDPNPSAENITSYKVFKDGAFIGSTTATNFTDNAAVVGTTVTYTVTAVNVEGESVPSDPLVVTPQNLPSKPTNVRRIP